MTDKRIPLPAYVSAVRTRIAGEEVMIRKAFDAGRDGGSR